MTSINTDSIWESKKDGSRIIIGKHWTLNGENYVEVFDTKIGKMVNMTEESIIVMYNFVDNNN